MVMVGYMLGRGSTLAMKEGIGRGRQEFEYFKSHEGMAGERTG